MIYDKQAKRARLPASVAKKWGLSSQDNGRFQQLIEEVGAELGYGKALCTTDDAELRGKSKLNPHLDSALLANIWASGSFAPSMAPTKHGVVVAPRRTLRAP